MLQSLTVAQTTDKDIYTRYADELKSELFVKQTNEKPEQERMDRGALDKLRNKVGRR